MDLPITLRFFEKLSVYQEIRKRDETDSSTWPWQRKFLRWAANPNYHQHRSTNIPVLHALDHLDEMGLQCARAANDHDTMGNIMHGIYGNLVSGELAVWSESANRVAGILVTPRGFLFGEVINDIGDGKQITWYGFLYGLSWVLFGLGVFIIFGEAGKMLYEFCQFVAAHVGCSCQ